MIVEGAAVHFAVVGEHVVGPDVEDDSVFIVLPRESQSNGVWMYLQVFPENTTSRTLSFM